MEDIKNRFERSIGREFYESPLRPKPKPKPLPVLPGHIPTTRDSEKKPPAYTFLKAVLMICVIIAIFWGLNLVKDGYFKSEIKQEANPSINVSVDASDSINVTSVDYNNITIINKILLDKEFILTLIKGGWIEDVNSTD